MENDQQISSVTEDELNRTEETVRLIKKREHGDKRQKCTEWDYIIYDDKIYTTEHSR